MEMKPLIVRFASYRETETQSYEVILKTINDAFAVAKGNLEKMRELNTLAKELRYATSEQIDILESGPKIPREETAPEARS